MTKTKVITMPNKNCNDCHFFTHHGNYQENFCGLYMSVTNNEWTPNGHRRTRGFPKPQFCKQNKVSLRMEQ